MMPNNIFLTLHIAAIFVSFAVFLVATVSAALYLIQDRNLKKKDAAILFSRLPNLDFLDKLNYRAIGFGFPLLTLGIISASFLAKQIWGVYWVWNFRDSYSLILWLIYAVTLHVRLTSKMRGRKIAWLSIGAFGIIVIIVFASVCGVIK